MTAFENHVHFNSNERFTKFQCDDVNQKLQNNILKIIFTP